MQEKLQIHFSKEDIIEALEDYYHKIKGGENKINISFDPDNGMSNTILANGVDIRVALFISEDLENEKVLEGKVESPLPYFLPGNNNMVDTPYVITSNTPWLSPFSTGTTQSFSMGVGNDPLASKPSFLGKIFKPKKLKSKV